MFSLQALQVLLGLGTRVYWRRNKAKLRFTTPLHTGRGLPGGRHHERSGHGRDASRSSWDWYF